MAYEKVFIFFFPSLLNSKKNKTRAVKFKKKKKKLYLSVFPVKDV